MKGFARTSLEKYKNRSLNNLITSPTVTINEKMRDILDNGGECYHLGFGQSPFPVPQIMVDKLVENAHRKEYAPVKGLVELRKAIAEYVSKQHGIERDEDDVLICPGILVNLLASYIQCITYVIYVYTIWCIPHTN